MKRATLRATVPSTDEFEITLPLRIRRIQFDVDAPIRFTFTKGDSLNGQEIASRKFDLPTNRPSGPIYISGAPGTSINLLVDHLAADGADTGGQGAQAGGAFSQYATFTPVAGKIPTSDSGTGTVAWQNLANWAAFNPLVTVSLDSTDTTGEYLKTVWWEPNHAIPTGATIAAIWFELEVTAITEGGTAGEGSYTLQMDRLRIIKGNTISTTDYVTNNGRGPSWPALGSGAVQPIFFPVPTDDPLWGETWAVSDFNSPGPSADTQFGVAFSPKLFDIQGAPVVTAAVKTGRLYVGYNP